MTEAEWEACEDPVSLMLFLDDAGASARKARLFGCACVRRVWLDLADERLRRAAAAAEDFADGLATPRRLEAARKKAHALCLGVGDIIADLGPMAVSALCGRGVNWYRAAESTAAVAAEASPDEGADWDDAHAEEERAPSAALRCIFGNPFRPITLDPACRTPTVVGLAQAAYDERILPSGELDSARLAVLADALEEAGAPEEMVKHLRGPEPHVRGCFAVDLCMGKS